MEIGEVYTDELSIIQDPFEELSSHETKIVRVAKEALFQKNADRVEVEIEADSKGNIKVTGTYSKDF